MGSCFSKCKPNRKNQEYRNPVEDKQVISQAPITSPLSSTEPSLSLSPPHSPTSSSTSFSSFSGTNSNTSGSLSLTSSSSSSILSSKERTFSNEFLRSCVKENPQIIHMGPIKENLQKPMKIDSPEKSSIKLVKQRKIDSTVTQKRGRSNSPTLTRQKSFRRGKERHNSPSSLPRNDLRSPSPSRTDAGDKYRGKFANAQKEIGYKAKAVNSGLSSGRKENVRPTSPHKSSVGHQACLMNRDTWSHRIGSKIDEIAVGDAVSEQDANATIPREEIDNPLIALDCFIFL
ncbi:hypothetical protein NMG60_11017772 [Bertholletia excelsa]